METDLLAQLISQKHEILVQLRDLSRRQGEFIGQGDMSRLMTVLSAKQTLLEEMQKIERRLDPFRQQDPESRRWRSVDDRRRCQELAERCASLLREIMLEEKQSESDLVRRRDEAAARLDGVHSAAAAQRAYAPAAPASTGLDLTSEE